MLKKSLCILTVAVLSIAFIGCGKGPNSSANTSNATTTVITDETAPVSSESPAETTQQDTTAVEDVTTVPTEASTQPTAVATTAAPVTSSKVSNISSNFDGYSGFLRRSDAKIVDKNGKEYVIKAINFGNNAMGYPKTSSGIVNMHHTEESYKELADMGFNSVRFLINYNLFEDDSAPYKYKQSGFDWIDQNIEWAKKYGIRLILDMHCPQGGYQSWDRSNYKFEGLAEGDALWTNKENQKRLAALWEEIAKHYKDEPVIIGYGILNEPMVAVKDIYSSDDNSVKYSAAVDLYQNLINDITESIRSVNTNQIIFVQALYAVKNLNNNTENWVTVNENKNFLFADDDNVVYEFHFYGPQKFTHQGAVGGVGNDVVYGGDILAQFSGTSYRQSSAKGKADVNNTDWQYVETELFHFKNKSWNALGISFYATNLGKDGQAYIDNLTLKEFDENGEYIRDIYFEDFETAEWKSYYFYDPGKSGSSGLSGVAYKGSQSLNINGTTSEGNITKYSFMPVQGHFYQASAYVKLENVQSTANVRPRVEAAYASGVSYVNKETVVSAIQSYIDFSKKYNVPIFCGEYGLSNNCYKDNRFGINRGGQTWVTDTLGFLLENGIGSAYHCYYGGSSAGTDFGMYQTYSAIKVGSSQRDPDVYNILKQVLDDYK